jgi:hypothetical protein
MKGMASNFPQNQRGCKDKHRVRAFPFLALAVLGVAFVALGQGGKNDDKLFFEREDLRHIYKYVFYVTDQIYHYRFDQAHRSADSLVINYPAEPEGYFYEAMILWKKFQTKIISLDSASNDGESYKQLLQKVVEICSDRLGSDGGDLRSMFYLAGAQGFLGRYEALKNNMFSAATQAKKGKEIFERILKREPRLLDANLALGLFNYYASMIPWYAKLFSWIIGISGEKELGIKQLEIAAQEGSLGKWEAAEVLSFAYINQERYRDAWTLLEPLAARFPENIEFHYGLALSYYKLKEWDSVIDHASPILETHHTVRYGEKNVIGYCYFVRARAFYERGRYEEAIADCDQLLALGLPPSLLTWTYLSRGEAHQQLGSVDLAQSDYETVVRRDDNEQAFQRARERMKELQRD